MVARLSLLLTLSLVFFACKDEDECPWPKPELVHYISDTSSHWFEVASNLSLLKASSSMGRTESYDIKWSGQNEGLGGLPEVKCMTHVGEHRYLRYTSSLYDHDFLLEIGKYGDDDLFKIGRYYKSGSVTFNPKNPYTCTITPHSYSTPAFSAPVLWSDSVLVNGKLFSNVFKVDFLEQKNSFDTTVRVMYFSTRHGLIQFETFSGEVWSLF